MQLEGEFTVSTRRFQSEKLFSTWAEPRLIGAGDRKAGQRLAFHVQPLRVIERHHRFVSLLALGSRCDHFDRIDFSQVRQLARSNFAGDRDSHGRYTCELDEHCFQAVR